MLGVILLAGVAEMVLVRQSGLVRLDNGPADS